MTTLVWAFQPLPELNNQLEFVQCDEELAAQLIKAGKVQDPRDGGLAMRHFVAAPEPVIRPETEQTYDDKAMTPKRRR